MKPWALLIVRETKQDSEEGFRVDLGTSLVTYTSALSEWDHLYLLTHLELQLLS